MTQREITEHYGITERTWRDWEVLGRRPRDAETLRLIAEDTGMSPAWLLGEV